MTRHQARNVYDVLDLRRLINVSGTMTGLGASIVLPEVIDAMASILPRFVEVDQLQRRASSAIANSCGSEAGFITASASAGITLAISGAMTGADLASIERLPNSTGLKSDVAVQVGHVCSYGAPLQQAICLSGANPVLVGTATHALGYQLDAALTSNTAAALYVVSHHVASYGMIGLEEFCALAHAKGVPVIVDAASEYDLRGFLALGADVVVYSAHKFLSGPTAGIVAGRKSLVRAAYLQNLGIGRGMKVGKESIYGAIVALEAWGRRDHAVVRANERAALDLWLKAVAGKPGVTASIVPDPTRNPLDRLRIEIDPEQAHVTAGALADALASGDQPIIVRDHEIEHGWFQLDPCNLHPGDTEIVAARLVAELDSAHRSNIINTGAGYGRRNRRAHSLLSWPD